MKTTVRIAEAHHLPLQCCCYNYDRNEVFSGAQDCLIKVNFFSNPTACWLLFCLEGVEGINFWGKCFHTNNTLLKPLTYCMSRLKQVYNYQNIQPNSCFFMLHIKWKVLLQRSLHPEIGMTIEQENDKYSAKKEILCVFFCMFISKVWDIESGRQLRVQEHHTNWVMDLLYVAAPVKMLFSCSLDGNVLAWNERGKLLQVNNVCTKSFKMH